MRTSLKQTVLFLFVALAGISCKQNSSLIGSTNTIGAVEKIYGAGYHRSAAIGWESLDPSTTQFGIFRHVQPAFSFSSALRIATVSQASRSGYIDTGLVDGKRYYYTVVPEKKDADGSIMAGLNTQTISVTPVDLRSLSGEEIIYSQHIQPIFTTACAVHGCHGGADDHALAKGTHGGSTFLLDSWTSAMNGTESVAQIVPYRATRSHMIHHLNTDTLITPVAAPAMPVGFTFPAELRDVVMRWIDAGAKNDDGTVAYSALPQRGWAYVTNQGEDLTAVIDLDRNRVARYVTTGVVNTSAAPPLAPHNAVVDRQNNYYYINLIGGSRLLKFRVQDNVKVGELATGLNSPAQVALTITGDTAYVSNFESAKTTIAVVDTRTMTKMADIGSAAMLKPHGMSITPDGKYVLVANSLSDNITVIRTSDNTIVKTVPVSGTVPSLPVGYAFQFEPYQSTVTPDSKFAYVTCRKKGEVRVLDLTSFTIIDSITVGTLPYIPVVSPDGAMVFVTNRNSNSVSAINTATRKVEYTLSDVGTEPHGIAVSKDGKYLYVSCENLGISEPPHHATAGGQKPSYLKVIDIQQKALVSSLELANFGSGMAVTN